MSYAHWIIFFIRHAVSQKSLETVAELSSATIEFPQYNMSYLLCHSRGRTPSQPSHRPEVPKTVAEQDEAVRAIAKTKLEQLEAQQEDVVESDPTVSSNEDYHPILHMPPCAHDREASGSSSAPP